MEKKVLWHLPGFCNKFDLYEKFIGIIEQFPDVLNRGHKIHCIYGCPPGSIWNGGRPLFVGEILSKERIEDEVNFYNSRNISIALTWSNCLLLETDLYDRYCNMVTKCCATNNKKNYIITANPLVYEYISSKYPDQFKMIQSVTRKNNNDGYDIGDPHYKYDLSVLHEDDNKDLFVSKYLNLPYIQPSVEILVNQSCVRECQYTEDHYNAISESNLTFSYCDYNCRHLSKHIVPDDAHKDDDIEFIADSNYLTRTDVSNLADMGFSHFKIKGRLETPYKLLDTLIYYLIKDDSKSFVRQVFGALKDKDKK